jgi:glutathione S-transferase
MENRLKDHDWLAIDRPTTADVACFPYVETAPEALISLDPYPGVVAWLVRCKALPGWAER